MTGGNSVNFGSDTVKMAIVTNATVPTVDTAYPTWGAGGTTNLSSNQVATATGYTGPITLAGTTFTTSAGGINTLNCSSTPSIAQDAGGFSNGYYAIIYDDTVADKAAIAFIDLAGAIGNVSGPINFTFGSSKIGTMTAT
jgi:uncharacterized protein YbbC (DUF1343 family)